nr:LPD7 domain-containing protein [Proteus mirabilis]
MNADTDFSFKKTVARKKQFNEFEEQVQNRKKLTDLVAHKKDKEVEYIDQKTKQVVFKDTGSHIEAKNLVSKNEATMMLEYAEKKYGGALRLSGSEAFKETIALAAAEKGMNIILTPEKYHEMMLKEVARLKEVQQQTNQDPKEQQINTITENQDIKLDNQAKPEKDNVVKEVEFLRDWLVNDNIYRNSLMNTKQIEKINSATDQMLSGHINNDKFLTIKAEVNAEIIKERTGIDVPIQDLKNDFNDRLTPEKTETQQISKEIADIQNSEALNPLPNNLTSKQVQEKIQDIPHTIDGKEFNKLIVVPVNKNDGFESHTEYRVAFKHDDKMVTQLKDVTESDLNRMGIDTKNIDMRKVDPVSINVTKLANSQVESPLKHAEKQLNTHIEHMKSKVWSRSEFEELKEQRGKLEANVDKAKAQHAPEQTQQNDHKNVQEQNKGQSM